MFPGGLAVKGSGIVTAVAQVTAVAGVQSLAREFPHAEAWSKKKKEIKHFQYNFKLKVP